MAVRELSFDDLERFLEIEPNDLDSACARHADLFYRVSKQLALEQSLRDAAKTDLAEAEAKADADIRHHFEVMDEKATEGKVNGAVRLSKSVIASTQLLHKRNLKVGQWTALKEAYVQRSYMLKSMIDLAQMNYYSEPTGTRSVRDKLAAQGRDAIRTKLKGEKDGQHKARF